MAGNKSQHYVPKMCMRLFAERNDERVGIFVLDKAKFVPNASIKGQFCKNYFYGRDGKAEQAFGVIETRTAPILKRAANSNSLPSEGSAEFEQLILYLGLQHCRTLSAAQAHEEASEKATKSLLRRKALLEGNQDILQALDSVLIKRTNAVAELVRYATIGASLLRDLTFVIAVNKTAIDFVSSDAPVVLHNRLFEGQDISVTGFANVGLQLFLPLGPRALLFGFDPAAYTVRVDRDGNVTLDTDADASLLNDLQWEAALSVILARSAANEAALQETWINGGTTDHRSERCFAKRWSRIAATKSEPATDRERQLRESNSIFLLWKRRFPHRQSSASGTCPRSAMPSA